MARPGRALSGSSPLRGKKRDAPGNWSLIATAGEEPGQVAWPTVLAVDSASNLYVADDRNGRVQKRDAQGNWSLIATYGEALGQVSEPAGLAVDAAGNLYVADYGNGRIQKRDAQGS